MIELESYSISGMRSLASVENIPVREPTIVTGANDGGRSTSLAALAFLLGGTPPAADDFTVLGRPEEEAPPLRGQKIEVAGLFRLDEHDRAALDLDDEQVSVRRVATPDSSPRYELERDAPSDERFRGLEGMKLEQLKSLAEDSGLPADGPRNTRESWLAPLRHHISQLPHERAWVEAPTDLVRRLPEMMLFSSTDEPDPEGQIRTALHAAFKELLDDSELVGPVREVESDVQNRLSEKAIELCEHVAERCPELHSIAVMPEVTFSEGFRDVRVFAAREEGAQVPLNQSGAGRRRRVNLAIWEWTGNLRDAIGPEDRAIVIAYDEPDTHLDYAHQRDLVELIQTQCSKPGVRMVVATHSLNLIDRVDMEDVVHLRLDGDRTELERLLAPDHESIDRYLAGVSEAMGLRNSVLLHERAFLGVEGPTEVQTIPILFRLATGMSLQSAGIALIAGNGNDGALNVVRFLKEHGRKMSFLVVDADSAERKLFRPDKLRPAGIEEDEINFVGSAELEDLFSDDQWALAANEHWPRDDGEDWTAAEFASLRDTPKFSKAIENTVRAMSSQAPQRKTGYLVALVQGLTRVEDVPEQLISLFRDLAALPSV